MCPQSDDAHNLNMSPSASRAGNAQRARTSVTRLCTRMLLCATMLLPNAWARADDLLDYLQAQGLDSLAALRIEELVEAATGDERDQLSDVLADLYTRMLDANSDPRAQSKLLARADAIAAGTSAASDANRLSTSKRDRLRIAAARARYRDAASVAERIRAGSALDPAASIESLGAQADELMQVAQRADKRATELNRRFDRESGLGRDLLAEEIDGERGCAGQARFLAAWSLLYRGFLAKDRGDSERAEALFAALLGARDGKLTPAEVSEDLRRDEAYAAAILGLALAKARIAGYSESVRWLALLDSPQTHPSLRDSLPGWSMVAALDARAFKQARDALAALASHDDAANWARVAVARAIEDGGSDAQAKLLAREGIALLAAQRDLPAVRELVARYGEGILGEDESTANSGAGSGTGSGAGFVARYVRAVRLFDDAQRAMTEAGEDPAKLDSDAVRAPAEAAAAALATALEASDVDAYPAAKTECTLMRALSVRAAGHGADAAPLFDAVAAISVGVKAEQASFLAIAALDDARRGTTDVATQQALERALATRIEQFLARFPGSEHVPTLLVRRIASSDDPNVDDVERLLMVPSESPEWLASRKQALGGLYRAFRGGNAPRADTARRYLAVLAELPREDGTGLPAGSSSIARQALEVVLAPEVRDSSLATKLIAALEASAAQGDFDMSEADEEIAYRRLQLAIELDHFADVATLLLPFEKPEATPIWADAGLRLALRTAESKRRAAPMDAPARAGFVTSVVRAGDAILAREGGINAALKSKDASAMQQIARITIDARVELVRSSGDAAQARASLLLTEALLAQSPRDAALLRAGAMFAETAGDLSRAAELLRTLVGGLPSRTTPWFEAKVDQLRVLAKLDPARARAVLTQFRTLYPELGPEPYHTQVLEIEKSLPAAASPAAPSEPSTSEPSPTVPAPNAAESGVSAAFATHAAMTRRGSA